MKLFAAVSIASCFSLGSDAISVLSPIDSFIAEKGLDSLRTKNVFLSLLPEAKEQAMAVFKDAVLAGADNTTAFEKMAQGYKTTGKWEVPAEDCACITWKAAFSQGQFHAPKGLDCLSNFIGGFNNEEFWCQFAHRFDSNECIQSEFGPESGLVDSVCYVDANCKVPAKDTMRKPVLKTCQPGRDLLLSEMSLFERETKAAKYRVDSGLLAMYSSKWVNSKIDTMPVEEKKAIIASGVSTYVMPDTGHPHYDAGQERLSIKGSEVYLHRVGQGGVQWKGTRHTKAQCLDGCEAHGIESGTWFY